MLLLRLLSTALCAAVAALVFALVYAVPPARVHPSSCSSRCPSPAQVRLIAEPTTAPHGGLRRAIVARADRSPGGVPINVIDVAPGVPAAQITGLIQLGPGEHVTAVNDRVPASDLEVGALIASLPRRGEYLDLSVASPTRERRVLVLLH
jgi:hypothetical protein